MAAAWYEDEQFLSWDAEGGMYGPEEWQDIAVLLTVEDEPA